MPFRYKNLSRIGQADSNSPNIYSYTTNDTIEQVLTPNYFQESREEFVIGDTILFKCSNNSGVLLIEQANGVVEARLSPNSALKSLVAVADADDFDEYMSNLVVFYIDGTVDLETSIEVPSYGVLINGHGSSKSKIRATIDNFDLFVNDGVADAGNLFINDLTIEVTGANSRVFALTDVDGTHAVEMFGVNFDNCTSLGYLDGFRQGLEINTGRFGGAPSLEFRGAWSGGYRIATSIARGIGSGTTLFKGAIGQTFASRFITDINAVIPPGSVGIDFAEANFLSDALLQINGAIFSGGGTYFQGIALNSTKLRISGNTIGILNSYVGGYWAITSEAGTSASGTIAKIAGVTTFDGVWFSEPADNAMTLDSEQQVHIEAVCQASFTGTASREYTLTIRHWDDSGSAYIDISSTSFTCNAAGKAENVSLITKTFPIEQSDRIEVWITDNSGTSTITMLNGSQFKVREVRS